MVSCLGTRGLTELAITGARPLTVLAEFSVKVEGTAGFLVNCCVCCPVAVLVECYELLGNRKSGYNHNDLFQK